MQQSQLTGPQLRAMRKAAGLSMAELGAKVGLSGPFIGEMERGEKGIELRTELAVRYVLEKLTGNLVD